MKIIRFTNRRAEPGRIRLGVEKDNSVERVRFLLPRLAPDQVETLYWCCDGHADAVLLDHGWWPIDARVTQHPGEFTCYIAIAAGEDVLWHSQAFYAAVYDLPAIEGDIDEAAPSAIQQAAQAAGQAVNAADAAQTAAREATASAQAAAYDAQTAALAAHQLTGAQGTLAQALQNAAATDAALATAEAARQDAEAVRCASETQREAAERARAAADQAREGRVAAVEEALGRKADMPSPRRPFGLFYANYGGPFIRDTIQQSAEAIAPFSVCVFAYEPNLETSCPAAHLEIIRRAKAINPALRVFSYITAASEHNGYALNPDGSWANSPAQQAGVARLYSRRELVQYFRDLRHVGGRRTGQLDAEGYALMEGGVAFDGAFLDEFGADNAEQARHHQGGRDETGAWRWQSAADKWNDLVTEAHRAGLGTVNNAWECLQMLAECTALTDADCVLVETCEFAGDENVASDSEVNWATYASAQRVYDFVTSPHYRPDGPRVVSYSTLSRNVPAALAERAFTWAVFDTLAMGGHYVYLSHTERFPLPEAVKLFLPPQGEEPDITRVEKGWFRLRANGHTLETIRRNADVYGPVTADNLDLAVVRVDGHPLRNACTTAPQLETSMDSRLTAAEARVSALTSDTKANAPTFLRLMIDDWQTQVTPDNYTNLFPTEFNQQSGIAVQTAASGARVNAGVTVSSAWGWCKQVYTAELLAPFLGKTLELGWQAMSFSGVSGFSDSFQFFVSLDGASRLITQATSTASLCGNAGGACAVFSVPLNCQSLEIGWQGYGCPEGASASVTGLYLCDTAEIEETAGKKSYTNALPATGYTAAACGEVTIASSTDSQGRRVFELSNTGMGNWGVYRADIAGAALEPFLGHTLELGVAGYEITGPDGLPRAGQNLKLILGADWSSGNALYPAEGAQTLRYTVPEDATQFSVGWQGSGDIEGFRFHAWGVYLYDLDEAGVSIRGRDPATTWLRVCRVTEAALAQNPALLGNALYITDAGRLFVTDFGGRAVAVSGE